VLLRLAYLTVTNALAALRLLPVEDRDKDAEILALRYQITVLERQLGARQAKFAPADRAFLAALVAPLPRQLLRRLRPLVRPDTVLRWHRDLMNQHHARTRRPKRPGRPSTGENRMSISSSSTRLGWSRRTRPVVPTGMTNGACARQLNDAPTESGPSSDDTGSQALIRDGSVHSDHTSAGSARTSAPAVTIAIPTRPSCTAQLACEAVRAGARPVARSRRPRSGRCGSALTGWCGGLLAGQAPYRWLSGSGVGRREPVIPVLRR
jgi:hypothetical protein